MGTTSTVDLGELEPPRLDERHVRLGRVGLDDDRAEARALSRHARAHLVVRDAAAACAMRSTLLRRSALCSAVITMLKDDRFSTRMRPLRSKTAPRGAGISDRADAVVLRQLAVVLAAQHLQVPEVDDQQRDRRDHARLDDAEAPVEAAQVLVEPHGSLTRRSSGSWSAARGDDASAPGAARPQSAFTCTARSSVTRAESAASTRT